MLLSIVSVLLTIVSFLIVLTILVFVHESGHALAARHVGVRVERFSIGFPPRILSKTIGETEYVFSLTLLGGYVKLLGQNIDDEDASDPRNYASKTILQRCYILVAGPAANLVLALLLMPVVFMLGVDTPAFQHGPAHIAGTRDGSLAEQAGFLPGDRIVAVGEVETPVWSEVYRETARQAVARDTVSFDVQRGSGSRKLELESSPIMAGEPIGWKPLIAPVVGALVSSSSPAAGAGLEPGDRITAIAGTPVTQWSHISREIQRGAISWEIQRGTGRELAFAVERNGETLKLNIAPEYNEDSKSWLIGISTPRVRRSYGLLESIRLGTARLWDITSTTFIFLGRLVSGAGSMDALGGPVKIATVVGEAVKTGAANLIFWMAFISLQLGIFNLLPVPPLDGGHIFLLALEKCKGSPLNARLREGAQLIGFSLLILLLVLVTYNDIL